MYNGGRRKVQTHLSAYNLQTGASNWYLSSNARLKGYNSKLPFFSGQDPRTHSVPTYCLVRHHGLFTDFVYWFFRPYNYGKNVCIGYITPCFGGCVGKSFVNALKLISNDYDTTDIIIISSSCANEGNDPPKAFALLRIKQRTCQADPAAENS